MAEPTENPANASLARERASQAALMRRKRAAGRDIEIRPVANWRRRRRCQKNPALFLKTYFPHIFTNPFNENQHAMIAAFVARINHGGLKAEASPRGEGKTMIALGLICYAICYGKAKFPVLVSANGDAAELNLGNLKAEFETNDLLADDFPEICDPIRALEGANQRANLQTFAGRRTLLKWRGRFLVFPTVAGSPASGVVVTCRGIDSAIRGLNYRGVRPDFVLIDDPETRDSSRSELEVDKRAKTLNEDIIGLAGPDKAIGILYLCTIWHANCLADRFTDLASKPAWDGSRRKLLKQMPTESAMALWDRYMEFRQRDQFGGDKYGRGAHRFYIANRAAMDDGSIVSNPYRFKKNILPDGSQLQVSALQFCFDQICDTDWDSFNTEYQNVPPAGAAVETLELTRAAVQQRISGRARGFVPADSDWLTAGVDLHGRHMEWVVYAWRRGVGFCIDYGVEEVHSPLAGSLIDPDNAEAIEVAIVAALADLANEKFGLGWPDETTGEVRYLDRCFIDSGYKEAAVYAFCFTRPDAVYLPSKGLGTARGQSRFRVPAKQTPGRRIGDHWFANYQRKHKIWLYSLAADEFKSLVHAGFRTGTSAAAPHYGALWLFGSDPVIHRHYASHIVAEEWRSEHVTGKGLREYWHPLRAANHWLDCTYYARAAAAVCGMPSVSPAAVKAAAAQAAAEPAAQAAVARRPRKLSLAQLQAKKRQERMR